MKQPRFERSRHSLLISYLSDSFLIFFYTRIFERLFTLFYRSQPFFRLFGFSFFLEIPALRASEESKNGIALLVFGLNGGLGGYIFFSFQFLSICILGGLFTFEAHALFLLSFSFCFLAVPVHSSGWEVRPNEDEAGGWTFFFFFRFFLLVCT